jgi:hypothetical protein
MCGFDTDSKAAIARQKRKPLPRPLIGRDSMKRRAAGANGFALRLSGFFIAQ